MNSIKTILLATLLFGSAMAMGQNIDQLYIQNTDPILPTDEVSVIATTWFPYSGCPLVYSQIWQSNDTVHVNIVHEMGLAAAICNSEDTTSLGSFAPGTYKVAYQLVVEGWSLDPEVYDSAYTEFTVQTVTGLEDEDDGIALEVFPNPCTEYIQVTSDYTGNAQIFNLQGQLVKTTFLNGGTQTVSTNEFEAGVYLLSVSQGNATGSKVFIVR